MVQALLDPAGPVFGQTRRRRGFRESGKRQQAPEGGMPMTRVALYARYSSDNQRDASIEDQLRL
jgi:hypothetical protein